MKKWKPFGKHGPAVPVYHGTGSAADAEAVRSAGAMASLKATATPVHLELEAFRAVMDGDYPRAVEILKAMPPKDRSVLVFWLRELTGMADDVELTEKRWSVEP